MIYGAIVRFYLPVLDCNVLMLWAEDLIELSTSLTLSKDLSDMVLKLCRLSYRVEEQELAIAFREYADVKPEQLGISTMLTLNQSSDLFKKYNEYQNKIAML